jgi:hypothetical protein
MLRITGLKGDISTLTGVDSFPVVEAIVPWEAFVQSVTEAHCCANGRLRLSALMPSFEGTRLKARSQVSAEVGDIITDFAGDGVQNGCILYGITVGRADSHSSP